MTSPFKSKQLRLTLSERSQQDHNHLIVTHLLKATTQITALSDVDSTLPRP